MAGPSTCWASSLKSEAHETVPQGRRGRRRVHRGRPLGIRGRRHPLIRRIATRQIVSRSSATIRTPMRFGQHRLETASDVADQCTTTVSLTSCLRFVL
jgi:hypothetical protein